MKNKDKIGTKINSFTKIIEVSNESRQLNHLELKITELGNGSINTTGGDLDFECSTNTNPSYNLRKINRIQNKIIHEISLVMGNLYLHLTQKLRELLMQV